MANSIPIQNIYYLLCYAWNRLEEGQVVDVSGVDSTELVDLFASVLIAGTDHLMRRGLERGYQTIEEELSGIRGRIQIATSARLMLLKHGRALCLHDELTPNTQANRIIKSTLRNLAKISSLNRGLKTGCLSTYKELRGIEDIDLSRGEFRKVQLHGNSRYYKFLLNICQIVAENLLVDESTGKYKFRDFLRDERRMARLFESFVFNFVRKERGDLIVKKEKIAWDIEESDLNNLGYLPQMETDISIRSGATTLIIDTKYYSETLTNYFGSKSIHASNLYQIFAYLKNLEARGGADAKAMGLLLYPKVQQDITAEYKIQSHSIGVQTIDLSLHWSQVRGQLQSIVQDRFPLAKI